MGGRANSVRVGGSPGTDLRRALTRVSEWYGQRGGRARLQVPYPWTYDDRLDEAGWHEVRRTYLLTTSVPRLLAATAADRADVRVRLLPGPTAEWLDTLSDAGDRAELAGILAAPPVVAFCEARSAGDGSLLAIGRGSLHERWLGVTSVETVVSARRVGLARTVMGALAGWAHEAGAQQCYLQVFATNTAALALYDRLGFTRHHAYVYRALP